MPNNFRLEAKTDLTPTGVEYLYTDSTGQGVRRLSLNNLATWLFGGTLSSYVSSAIAAAIAAFAPSSTWTPALTFGGNAVGITYGSTFGEYQIVGNLITCSFSITLTSKGSSTGAAVITSLPFAGIGQPSGGVVGHDTGMLGLSGPIIITNSGSTILLFSQGATGSGVIADTNFTGTSSIQGIITYFKA